MGQSEHQILELALTRELWHTRYTIIVLHEHGPEILFFFTTIQVNCTIGRKTHIREIVLNNTHQLHIMENALPGF